MQNIYPTARSARPGVPKTPSGAYHTDYWERIPHTELRQGAFPLVKGRKRMEISGREFCNKPNPLFFFGRMAGGGIVLKISMRQPEKIALCRESRLPRLLRSAQTARQGRRMRRGNFVIRSGGREYRKDVVPTGTGARGACPQGWQAVVGVLLPRDPAAGESGKRIFRQGEAYLRKLLSGGWSVLPLKKVKREAAAQRRPARSERKKSVVFPRSSRSYAFEAQCVSN